MDKITNQRHTPLNILDAVCNTIGIIDVDPCSNDLAQQNVEAKTYYTAGDPCQNYELHGNVFCNPPYSQAEHLSVAKHIVKQTRAGNIKQAIIITPSDSSTEWYRLYTSISSAICLTRRLEFYNPYKGSSSNMTTNFIFYVGDDVNSFTDNFEKESYLWPKNKKGSIEEVWLK